MDAGTEERARGVSASMKGFVYQLFIGTIMIIILFALMIALAPVYIDHIGPKMKDISNFTAVDDAIDLGIAGLIGVFVILIAGIIIWMVASTQKDEFDSGLLTQQMEVT